VRRELERDELQIFSSSSFTNYPAIRGKVIDCVNERH
jgi:hypothetical protein